MNKDRVFKILKLLIPVLLVAFVLSSAASVDSVYAGGRNPDEGCVNCGGVTGGINNPLLPINLQAASGASFFNKLLPNLISLGFVVGVVVFLGMLIFGAIKWIASGGDKASVEGARGTVTNAIIGIIVLFSVFAIVALIEFFFGIEILTIDTGTLMVR